MTSVPEVEQAHNQIWDRFVDKKLGIMYDFTDLDGSMSLPTNRECLSDKPNAMSWMTPIENGALLGGFYLDALCSRWMLTGSSEDRTKATRIASGLMHLAQVGQTPGFVARGVLSDNTTHYAMSSNDQSAPWFYGLWRYVQSGIPDEEERNRIVEKMVEFVMVLRRTGWKMPCDRPPFEYCAAFAEFDWISAPRLLFMLRATYLLTGQEEWLRLYNDALTEMCPTDRRTRLDICEAGMVFSYEPRHSWTAAAGAVSLRALWEMETSPPLREKFAAGMNAGARLAAQSLGLSENFDNNDESRFYMDWRAIHEMWRPQRNTTEAWALGHKQFKRMHSISPRRLLECDLVREPLFAAWVVSLCPDPSVLRQHAPALMKVIRHYRYERLYLSQFFPAESAYYSLRLNDMEV